MAHLIKLKLTRKDGGWIVSELDGSPVRIFSERSNAQHFMLTGEDLEDTYTYWPDQDPEPDYEAQWEDRCGDPEAALDRMERSYERYIMGDY